MNETKDVNLLTKFTEDFCNIVKKHCDYVIVSGFLAISSGRSRGTEDIDIIIPPITLEKFKELHEDLSKKFILFHLDGLEIAEVYDYLKDSNIRYVYKNRVLPNMELKFARNKIDFDNLKTRKKIPFTDVDVYFAPIECAIAYKEFALKGEKDLEDAEHLKKVYLEEIDPEKIKYYERMIKEVYR